MINDRGKENLEFFFKLGKSLISIKKKKNFFFNTKTEIYSVHKDFGATYLREIVFMNVLSKFSCFEMLGVSRGEENL